MNLKTHVLFRGNDWCTPYPGGDYRVEQKKRLLTSSEFHFSNNMFWQIGCACASPFARQLLKREILTGGIFFAQACTYPNPSQCRAAKPPMGKLHDGQNADGGKEENWKNNLRERERGTDSSAVSTIDHQRFLATAAAPSKVGFHAGRSCNQVSRALFPV